MIEAMIRSLSVGGNMHRPDKKRDGVSTALRFYLASFEKFRFAA